VTAYETQLGASLSGRQGRALFAGDARGRGDGTALRHLGIVESDRIVGNGRVYKADNAEDLARLLSVFTDGRERRSLGTAGRPSTVRSFSWTAIARSLESDFAWAHGRRQRVEAPLSSGRRAFGGGLMAGPFEHAVGRDLAPENWSTEGVSSP
jgi:hypothetical protein